MKCERCGKDCKDSITKDKEHGWVCMDCYQKIIAERLKGGALKLDRK